MFLQLNSYTAGPPSIFGKESRQNLKRDKAYGKHSTYMKNMKTDNESDNMMLEINGGNWNISI
jgi:hypothetical protein